MRILPNVKEVEGQVLAGLILYPEHLSTAVEILNPTSFYLDKHGEVYSIIIELFDRGKKPDLVSVSEELKKQGKLARVGGVSYLASLEPSRNIPEHCKIIQEKYLQRKMIQIAHELQGEAYSEQDVFETIEKAEEKIYQISNQGVTRNYTPLSRSLAENLERYKKIHSGELQPDSIKTGFVDIDKVLGGFYPTDLAIIAARPSIGKTSLGLSIILNHPDIPIGLFSLEMSTSQVVSRLICMDARTDMTKLREGKLDEDDWEMITHTRDKLSKYKVFIDDSAALTPTELRAKARRMKSEHKIKIMLVDYMQLMQHPTSRSREDEIGKISSSLKNLAKQLEIPIIAMSQLNRANELRKNKRPTLADLRDSGRIEQDADTVLFIHRPEVYGVDTYSDGTSTKNLAEIIIAKNRNGEAGVTKPLTFLKQSAIFFNKGIDF